MILIRTNERARGDIVVRVVRMTLGPSVIIRNQVPVDAATTASSVRVSVLSGSTITMALYWIAVVLIHGTYPFFTV